MNQGFSDNDLLLEQRGGLGVITLNRPRTLNALTLEMIRQISAALRQWEGDASIRAVFFRGAGERAFCAGGDLKAFHLAGMDFRRGNVTFRIPAQFFAEEYSLNRQIFHYSKPAIAFMNGIVMGGGFGIGGNCRYRVATDKTVFAMPETGIGFFPDVGSVYHLSRCPQNIGRYLALTGIHTGPDEMAHAGLAGYIVPPYTESTIMEDLAACALSGQEISEILDNHSRRLGDAAFSDLVPRIQTVFRHTDIHGILGALAQDGSAWAEETMDILRRRAPASVLVTAAHFIRSAGKNFDAVIETDFILAQRFVERMDLYEGIRAVLIDKDNKPQWNPASFEELGDKEIAQYFEPTGYELKDVEIFAG